MIDDRIEKAGIYAKEYYDLGYHCSESIIRAVPKALNIQLSDDVVKAACAFFGGGGGTGGRCGVIESGIIIISMLYGRTSIDESENQLRPIVAELIDRFTKEFESTQCKEIKPLQVGKGRNGCEQVYIKGAKLLTKLLIEYM